MTIGERIKELRRKNELTQEKLAEYLCVSYQAVSKWENGVSSPDLSLIAPLSRLLHTTADELLGVNDPEQRAQFDAAYEKYPETDDIEASYHLAKQAVIEYPGDFRYLEWLGAMEYRLALAEETESGGNIDNAEFFWEMMDNSKRHFRCVIDNCTDAKVYSHAVWGMIVDLCYLEEMEDARWYAEVVYPEKQERTRDDAIALLLEGEELLAYYRKMAEETRARLREMEQKIAELESAAGSE